MKLRFSFIIARIADSLLIFNIHSFHCFSSDKSKLIICLVHWSVTPTSLLLLTDSWLLPHKLASQLFTSCLVSVRQYLILHLPRCSISLLVRSWHATFRFSTSSPQFVTEQETSPVLHFDLGKISFVRGDWSSSASSALVNSTVVLFWIHSTCLISMCLFGVPYINLWLLETW